MCMNEVAVEVVQALSFEGKGDEAKTVADELCWGDIEGSNLIMPLLPPFWLYPFILLG